MDLSYKNGAFPATTLLFWKIRFQINKLLQKVDLFCGTNYQNVHIHTFHERWSFFEGVFS